MTYLADIDIAIEMLFHPHGSISFVVAADQLVAIVHAGAMYRIPSHHAQWLAIHIHELEHLHHLLRVVLVSTILGQSELHFSPSLLTFRVHREDWQDKQRDYD